MRRKLPPDAFAHYVGLGIGRSYQAVADYYGASKVAVSNMAKREEWQKRLGEIEERGRESAKEKAVETLDEMNERHLRVLKVVQGKALETLSRVPLATAMDAVRALDMTMRQTRLVMGEPTDRTAVSVESLIRREYDRWLVDDTEPQEGEGDGDGHLADSA